MAKEPLYPGFIDGPTPYDTLESWEQHLKELQSWPPETVGRGAMLARAKKWIERIKSDPLDGQLAHEGDTNKETSSTKTH